MLGKHFVMMRSPNRISACLFQNADDRSDTVSWRILQQDMYMVFITFFSRNPPVHGVEGHLHPVRETPKSVLLVDAAVLIGRILNA